MLDLVEAYTFGGEGQKSFVVFARALRLWDESPELFDASDEHNLFWEFKWIASDLPDYPQIRREQAEAFLDDMQRRFELQGSGVSAVLAARFGWAWQSGATGAEAPSESVDGAPESVPAVGPEEGSEQAPRQPRASKTAARAGPENGVCSINKQRSRVRKQAATATANGFHTWGAAAG